MINHSNFKNFMKISLTVLFLSPVFAMAAPERLEDQMACQLVFGNAVFKSFTIHFKAQPESTGVATEENANRKVQMTLTYMKNSQFEDINIPASFSSETTVYNAIQGFFEISIEDLNDYAGATIDFNYRDDKLGNMAVMKYGSDGNDALGIFQCGDYPRFTWH